MIASPLGYRRTVAALIIAAAAAVVLLLPSALAASRGPAKACGSFAVPGTTIHVGVVRGHVSCGSARRVMRAFWTGHGTYRRSGRHGESYTSVLGWRCPNIRAGSSECFKGHDAVSGAYATGKQASP
jgi:hypothetical protein